MYVLIELYYTMSFIKILRIEMVLELSVRNEHNSDNLCYNSSMELLSCSILFDIWCHFALSHLIY